MGWPVERLNNWHVPEHLLQVTEPVLYVEALFGPTIAEQFGLQMLEPPIDWLPKLPERFRKRSIYLANLKQARQITMPAFIKPPNDKSFPAKVYIGAELPEGYDEEMPVLVSEIVIWEKEFRCFVLDRQPRTISIYLRQGELQRENEFRCSEQEKCSAIRFVEEVLEDQTVELPRTAVLDVGIIEGKGWAIVEQNSAWGAGIYGCDPEQVLEVLRFASERKSM